MALGKGLDEALRKIAAASAAAVVKGALSRFGRSGRSGWAIPSREPAPLRVGEVNTILGQPFFVYRDERGCVLLAPVRNGQVRFKVEPPHVGLESGDPFPLCALPDWPTRKVGKHLALGMGYGMRPMRPWAATLGETVLPRPRGKI